MKETLNKVFALLNERIELENKERQINGTPMLKKVVVKILGQASMLVQPKLTSQLDLAQTGDLDALLDCEYFVVAELKKILPKFQLIYDEDSHLIFIPKGSRFSHFVEFENVIVKVIDPESALVSKAVKAPNKNKQLIRAALASEKYELLAERIVSEGGNLDPFI